MLKQSPSRNQRSKGFKVKHVLQICLLLAICIWLLNRVKHSYGNKVYDDTMISGKGQNELESVKLGRKDIHSRVERTSLNGENQGDVAESDDDSEDGKLAEDVEDGGRGGGDDEIDGHDQERAEEESEEVEDLIDVDDREREEQQDGGEKGSNLPEDGNSVGVGVQKEGKRSIQEAREEHYKGDDASSFVGYKHETINAAQKESSNSVDSLFYFEDEEDQPLADGKSVL